MLLDTNWLKFQAWQTVMQLDVGFSFVYPSIKFIPCHTQATNPQTIESITIID
jgi:hypothetical protein